MNFCTYDVIFCPDSKAKTIDYEVEKMQQFSCTHMVDFCGRLDHA